MWRSKRLGDLGQSDIRAMTKECHRVGGINMGQGLCELETPREILTAAQQALVQNRKNIYSPAEGIPELRQAIAKKLREDNHLDFNPENEIIVVNGATGGYAATLMALLNPGDGILLFEPFYGYHINAALLAGLEPHYVAMSDANLGVSKIAIEHALRPNTRAILICTPANPSGKMWTEAELKIISDIAREKNLLVITDEMYEYFRYDGRAHVSPAAVAGLQDRTVSLMGLSKTFSITGWRLGYVAAPQPLAEKIRLANDFFYVCAPTPLQHAAVAGFSIDKKYFSDLRIEFEQRRARLCEALEQAGMKPLVPQGAYYVLADVSRFGFFDSKMFALDLLEKTGVAVIPGRSFFAPESPHREKYVRAHFALEESVFDDACRRLRKLALGRIL